MVNVRRWTLSPVLAILLFLAASITIALPYSVGLGGLVSEKLLARSGVADSSLILASVSNSELSVLGFAPVISTTPAVTNLGGATATLYGNISTMNGLPSSTGYFQWGYDPAALTNTTSTFAANAVGAHSLAIPTIHPINAFYYRFATDADGTSYGTTLSAPVVVTVAAIDIIGSTALLQGEVNLATEPSMFVRFEYGTSTGYGQTTAWQTFDADSNFSASVTNLSSTVTYHFRAIGLYGAASYTYGEDSSVVVPVAVIRDVQPEITVSDWFQEPDVSGSLLTNPMRPLVIAMSDPTSLTEIQVWRIYAIIIVLMVTVATARAIPRHLFLTGVAAGTAHFGFVAMTVFPMWSLVFLIGYIVGGLVAEKTVQL